MLGGALGGKTFDFIFENDPKHVEFVDSWWVEEKCTGLFLEFFKYVKSRLHDPLEKEAHYHRCVALVKTLSSVPKYLLKYKNGPNTLP